MKRIYLVRHGETFQNLHRVVQGWDPTYGRLTERGVRQATLLGQAMMDTPLDAAWCSTLERSVLTLAQILVPRKGDRTLPIVFAPELREINMGHLHGKPHTEQKAAIAGQDPISFAAGQGGESWLDVQARVSAYFEREILNSPYRNILIVAHGGVNRGILATLTGHSMAEAWQGPGLGMPQENTCVNILDLDERQRLVRAVVNDTTHLLGELDSAGGGQVWHVEEQRWELLSPQDQAAWRPDFNPYG